MLIASMTGKNGKKLLVLGLEEDNMKRLRDDQPIYKSLSTDATIEGLEDWDVTILGPEDTVRFVAQYGIKKNPA